MGSLISMQWPSVRTRARESRGSAATLVVSGAFRELGGRWMVFRGALTRDDLLRARGHRQQLVGMLQRLWKRDRHSVEAWVDALVRRSAPIRASGATRLPHSWRRHFGMQSLRRER